MFEIRIICDDHDADRIKTALAEVFDTGPPRLYPARDTRRTRLYITADHQPTTPESE
ncbi:hypothetical protein V1460_01265 [Streptomyces sp. SCSIO 30461]|uniref:hypothetical protein n=1 Tax=Streptomyces sp. SCSIO 30461 TaxID=3118085 RepID=UPI0030D2F178